MSNNKNLGNIYIQTLHTSTTLFALQHKTNDKHVPECDECYIILQKYLQCETSGNTSHGINTTDAITAPIDVSGITNYSSSILDLLELKIEGIIIIGYHLDTIDLITVENGFIIIIGYHLDTVDPAPPSLTRDVFYN